MGLERRNGGRRDDLELRQGNRMQPEMEVPHDVGRPRNDTVRKRHVEVDAANWPV